MNENSKLPAPAIREWLNNATAQLSHSPTSRLDSELILAHCLNQTRAYLIAHSDDELAPYIYSAADSLLARRNLSVPLAYLTGKKEFYGRDFIVTPDTLIPRPESETLIDLAKEYCLSGQTLDVGCGSGALGLTLALELSVELTISDVSAAALDVARRNAKALGVAPVHYVTSDLLDQWISHENPTPLDAIVANLPYVNPAWERSPETKHEPALALFADDNGLALIFKLLSQAPLVLRTGGLLLLEADPEQHQAIILEAEKNGLQLETVRDYIVVLKAL